MPNELSQAVGRIENRIMRDPDEVRREVLKAQLASLDKSKKAAFLKGMREFIAQDIYKDSAAAIEEDKKKSQEAFEKRGIRNDADQIVTGQMSIAQENQRLETLRMAGIPEEGIKKIREEAENIRKERVAQYVDNVKQGQDPAAERATVVGIGDPRLLQVFNAEVKDEEVARYNRGIDKGEISKYDAIKRAKATFASEVARELAETYRQEILGDEKRKIRETNADPSAVANRIRTELGDHKLADMIEKEFLEKKKADSLMGSSSVLDIDIPHQLQALSLMPEFANLPRSTRARIEQSFVNYENIRQKLLQVDQANATLAQREADLARAKRFDAEWKRFVETSKNVLKYGSMGVLAIGVGGLGGYAIGNFAASSAFGSAAVGAGGGAMAGAGAAGGVLLGGGIVGLKYLNTGAKLKQAEYNKIIAESEKEAQLKEAEIVAQGEMGTIRRVESAQIFIDNMVELVANANPELDKEKVRQEIERRAGIGPLRLVAQRVRSAVSSLDSDTLSLLGSNNLAA